MNANWTETGPQLAQTIQNNRLVQAIQHNQIDTNQWTSLIGGGLLVGFGLARRGLIGLGLAALGGRMIYKTVQQIQCPAGSASCRLHAADAELPPNEVRSNRVDEASWESFPASDSPGNY